jgi:hypothetical protein
MQVAAVAGIAVGLLVVGIGVVAGIEAGLESDIAVAAAVAFGFERKLAWLNTGVFAYIAQLLRCLLLLPTGHFC